MVKRALRRLLLLTVRPAVNAAMIGLFPFVALVRRFVSADSRPALAESLGAIESRAKYIVRRRRPRYRDLRELIESGADRLERRSQADIIIVDNFYEDPDQVRAYALGLEYTRYSADWYSSALEEKESPLRGRGVRLADESIKRKLAKITGSEIDEDSWDTSGDGWNGAFHYSLRHVLPRGAGSLIHNHVGRDTDVVDGWSGLVYLTPNAVRESGTGIWMSKATGRCYSLDSVYDKDIDAYDLAFRCENVYNRLVLFYASVLHMAEEGFGTTRENGRVFQTFFFNVKRPPSSVRRPLASG
jgi:hypothetical protein